MEEKCSICHNQINKDKSVYTECGHRFCSKCFFTWMKENTTCPNCRAQFARTLNDQHEEVDNLAAASMEWERYLEELQNNCIDLEIKISDMSNTYNEYSIKCSRLGEEQRKIKDKLDEQKLKYQEQERRWRSTQMRRAAYAREWRELHAVQNQVQQKKNRFSLRF